METRKVRAKVIMLPTENKSLLHTHSKLSTGCEGMGSFQTLKLTDSKTKFEDPDWDGNIPQHLYFTTDGEIKEGDWFIGNYTKLRKCTSNNAGNINFNGGWYSGSSRCTKIVATTDTSLGLPEPSQAFIQKYCELGGIDEVDIEYKIMTVPPPCYEEFEPEIKIDSHNTITIHSVKDSWSREEVIDVVFKYNNLKFGTGKDSACERVIDWLNKNL